MRSTINSIECLKNQSHKLRADLSSLEISTNFNHIQHLILIIQKKKGGRHANRCSMIPIYEQLCAIADDVKSTVKPFGQCYTIRKEANLSQLKTKLT